MAEHELLASAAAATDQAEQAVQRAGVPAASRDRLVALATADTYANLAAAYALRAMAEADMDGVVAGNAFRCEACRCCVGTYKNYRDQQLCTECADGEVCPRQQAARIRTERVAAKARREADDAAAELNRGHTSPNLDDRQRVDLLSLRLLLSACNRMRDDWAESGEERRAELWTAVHTEADNVFDRYHERMSFLNRIDWADKMAPLDPRRTTTADLLTVHSVSYGDLPRGSRFIVEGDGHVRVRVVTSNRTRESIRRLAVPPGSTLDQMLTPAPLPPQHPVEDARQFVGHYGGSADLVNRAADYVTEYHTEPAPVNTGDSVTDTVIRLLDTRREHGTFKYGSELRTYNGRDPMKDLQEELADALCYVTQQLMRDDEAKLVGHDQNGFTIREGGGRYIHLPHPDN